MKTRILLLALGFPARNHLERGAQLSMREYHKCLLVHAFTANILLTMFGLFVLLCFATLLFLVGFPYAIAIATITFLMAVALIRTGRITDEEHFARMGQVVYSHTISAELEKLCIKVGIAPIPVYRDCENFGKSAHIHFVGGHHLVTVGSRLGFLNRAMYLQSVLAHELGHALLPLYFLEPALSTSSVVAHAQESACDAIGALIIGDAMKVALLFHHLGVCEPWNCSLPSDTHPSYNTRVRRLFDIHVSGQNAR